MRNSRKGQSIVEYFLILVLVSVACIMMLQALGSNLRTTFNKVNSAMSFDVTSPVYPPVTPPKHCTDGHGNDGNMNKHCK